MSYRAFAGLKAWNKVKERDASHPGIKAPSPEDERVRCLSTGRLNRELTRLISLLNFGLAGVAAE